MHFPIAATHADHIALPDAGEPQRQRGHHIGEIEGPLIGAFVIERRRHPRLAVERKGFGDRHLLDIQRQHPRGQPRGARGDQFRPELALQPSGKADVIGVVMGDDHARDRLAAKRPCHQPAPNFLGPARGKARVDHRPAIALVQGIDVDVIQLHRQRQAEPKHPRRHLDRLPLGGRHLPRIAQPLGGFWLSGGEGGLLCHQLLRSSTSSA